MNDVTYADRLLIVDDEPAFATLIAKIAANCGYEVSVTDNARAFAKAARSWNPTVIVLDLNMPGTDGIQLLRGLAADKCGAHVVICSGSDGRVLDAAMRLGHQRGLQMSGVLPKPIRAKTVQEMLQGFKRFPKELLATDLAKAIASDHLFLEYQPKWDCRLGRFTGVEGLVRWHHPGQGIIRPDEFICLAEETDLIHRLTDWVVVTAARQGRVWQAAGIDLEIAVNISARDAEDIELPERLHQHCTDAGFDPSSMMLELTETGAMRQAVQMMDVLTRLRLKGFNLSIDDFGTGYSSLVQLQQLPFSEIKIDRSFTAHLIANEGCRVIAEITVELARRLGLKCIAEGVEDEATLNAVVRMGCDAAQGYHLSRPIAPERIADLVRHNPFASDAAVA